MTTKTRSINSIEKLVELADIEDKYNNIENLFNEIKGSKKLNSNIAIRLMPELALLGDDKDLGRQLIYYRILKGLERKDIAKLLNIKVKTYGQYENGKNNITDVRLLNKLLNLLDAKDNIILPDYIKFLMNSPEKKIIEYINNKNISAYNFAQKIGVKPDTVTNWLTNKTKISKDNYLKLKKILK